MKYCPLAGAGRFARRVLCERVPGFGADIIFLALNFLLQTFLFGSPQRSQIIMDRSPSHNRLGLQHNRRFLCPERPICSDALPDVLPIYLAECVQKLISALTLRLLLRIRDLAARAAGIARCRDAELRLYVLFPSATNRAMIGKDYGPIKRSVTLRVDATCSLGALIQTPVVSLWLPLRYRRILHPSAGCPTVYGSKSGRRSAGHARHNNLRPGSHR